MIYVTHDPAEALAVGDRVAVMHGGKIEQIDAPEVLVRRPASRVVAELLAQDEGGLTTIDGRLVAGPAFEGPWGRWPLPAEWAQMPAGEVTLGLRELRVRSPLAR